MEEKPYSSPTHGKVESDAPRPIKYACFYVAAGLLIGVLVCVVTVFALRMLVRGVDVQPDIMPVVFAQLLLANVCLGALLGLFVTWLRIHKKRRVTFGSTPHIAGMAWAITTVATYLYCRPAQQQVVDANRIVTCLAVSTIATYLLAIAIIVFRSRPLPHES